MVALYSSQLVVSFEVTLIVDTPPPLVAKKNNVPFPNARFSASFTGFHLVDSIMIRQQGSNDGMTCHSPQSWTWIEGMEHLPSKTNGMVKWLHSGELT